MGRTRWAVAAVAVVASLFSFAFSALAFAPGKARWPIKTSVPEGGDLDHPSRADLGDLIDADKLPDAPGVTKNDARFQDALIPKFDNPLGVTEGNILSTVGWLHLVAAEADGDYHIQISPAHDDDHGTDFLIVEVPTPETEFVVDTSLHPRLEAVRSLIRERMLRGSEPSTRGSVLTIGANTRFEFPICPIAELDLPHARYCRPRRVTPTVRAWFGGGAHLS